MTTKFRNLKDRTTKPASISLSTSTASLKTRIYLLVKGKQTTNHTKVRFGFALPRYAIGGKKNRATFILNQSEVKPKPIVIRSITFSRALRQLHVFAASFDWFIGLSVSFVIGHIDHFGSGIKTLNSKSL